MKVLHVSPTYFSPDSVVGGGEKYITYMARALERAAALDHRVVDNELLAVGDRPGPVDLGDGLPCRLLQGRAWDPHSLRAADVRAELQPADVVVVHQCLSAFGMYVGSHARAMGKLVVGMDHGGGEHPLVHHTPEVGRVYDLFLAQSAFAASSFRDLDGQVVVVPGPVDTDLYRPDPRLRREPDLVVALGRLLPHKGFDVVVGALPAGLRLVVAGTPSDPSYWELLQHEASGSAGEVQFLSDLSDAEVTNLLQRAGLFVHASTHLDFAGRYYPKPELLGLAPLEALACGTPTLASTAGSLVELHDLVGCRGFTTPQELGRLLMAQACGVLEWAPAEDIHASVRDRYGSVVFGRSVLTALDTLRVAA